MLLKNIKDDQLQDIFLQLNVKQRRKLRIFITNLQAKVDSLSQQKRKLQTEYDKLIETAKKLLDEHKDIEIQIITIDDELKNDPNLKNLILEKNALLEQKLAMERELGYRTTDLTNTKSLLESCKFSFDELDNEINELVDLATKLRNTNVGPIEQKIGFDILQAESEAAIIAHRQKVEAKAAEALFEQKNIIDKLIASALGVFLIVRVRCASQKSEAFNIDADEKGMPKITLTLPNKTIYTVQSDKNKSVQIFNDLNQPNCQTNPKFTKGSKFAENANHVKNLWVQIQHQLPAAYDELKRLRNEWEKLLFKFVKTRASKESYYENPEGESIVELNTAKANFEKGLQKAGVVAEMVERIVNSLLEEADSMYKTLSVTNSFVNATSISFIDDMQDLEQVPKVVTIIGIGASASGKTTSSHGIFQSLFVKYVRKFADDMKNANIRLDFYEVYFDHRLKQIRIVGLEPNYEGHESKLTYPLLDSQVLHRARLAFNSVAVQRGTTFCFNDDKKDKPNNCQTLAKDKPRLFTALLQIMEQDRNAERARTTKYTPINLSGSSRGIRVTKVTCLKKDNTTLFQINLVDTAGYEYYTNGPVIQEQYKNLFAQAQNEDAEFRTLLMKRSAIGRGSLEEKIQNYILAETLQYTTEIMQETKFINGSLEYIRNSLLNLKKFHSIKDPSNNQKGVYDIKYKTTRQDLLNEDVKEAVGGDNTWIQKLDLMPTIATVIVVGAINPNPSEEEINPTIASFKFFDEIARA